MTHRTPSGERPGEQAVLLVAGVADLVVDTIGSAAGTLRALLRRSDAADLARDAQAELTARGRLALDRHANAPVAHMELLARQAIARRTATGDDA